MNSYDWIIALRQQVENLARRNEVASRCTFIHNRTKEMASRIVRLRELIVTNPAEAATFYIECSREMDALDRIVRRTTRRATKRARNRVVDSSNVVDLDSPSTTPAPSEINDPGPSNFAKKLGFNRLLCLPREDEYVIDNGVRNLWTTQTEFFLACLGFIVGVGNTLRFPAKVYEYGGGVFFIPYFTFLFLFGLPIVYMHLCIGQYSGLSPNGAFGKLMPIASGVGWALVLLAIPVCIYYNVIVAWAVYYFWFSFRGFVKGIGLPWDRCLDTWVTQYNCCDLHQLQQCFKETNGSAITAPEAYFHFEVLHRPGAGDFELGPIQAHLVLALAVAWILVFFGVFKGIGSIGWMGSVTATVPYLLLLILLLRGVSLPGADDGLSFFFTPKLEKLWSLPMWKSAAEQVFYELGIDAGPLIVMASFSRYRNNIYRDAVLLVIFDAITSVLCGMVIFSFIGFLAHMSDSEVNTVLQHDPLYLAFAVYPGVTSFMHLGPLWGALFFAALVMSALDAEFAWMEMIASSVMYQLGWKNKRVENRMLASLCFLFFVLGLPFCTRGGIYIFHAIENLNANWNSFSLGLLQMFLICFIYGVDRFLEDIGEMIRATIPNDLMMLPLRDRLKFVFGPVGPYIKWAWSLFCPAILTALLFASAFSYQRVTFEGQNMPWIYEAIAWIVMVSPLLVIPFAITNAIIDNRKRKKPWSALISTVNWRVKRPESNAQLPMKSVKPMRPLPANGYSYIDPVSREQSTKSRLVVEEDYGRRTGRIADFLRQQAALAAHENRIPTVTEEDTVTYGDGGTYGPRTFSNRTPSAISVQLRAIKNPSNQDTHSTKDAEMRLHFTSQSSLPLFGSPPLSASNSVDLRQGRDTRQWNNLIRESPLEVETLDDDDLRRVSPPSPPHSNPPTIHSIRELELAVTCAFNETMIPRNRTISEDYGARADMINRASEPCRPDWKRGGPETSSSSNTSSDNEGRPNRPTVIRKYTSSDSISIAPSAAPSSLSITPLDKERHRSVSSVALFEQSDISRRQPKLSQLKRPKPIDAPSSLGPSPATSHF